MQPDEILAATRNLGVRLSADGETIIARQKGATPRELAEAICVHKTELLGLLAARKNEERRKADRLAKRGYDFDSSGHLPTLCVEPLSKRREPRVGGSRLALRVMAPVTGSPRAAT
jgi:hypothetical protein